MNHGDNYADFKEYEDEKEVNDNDSQLENKDVDKTKEKLNDPTSNQDEINNITVNHIQDWKELDD